MTALSKLLGTLVFVAIALAAATAGSLAASNGGQTPDYRDDRSTPEAVVKSLYNAVGRQEYLRAWSYFRDGPDRPSFESFAKGYETTAHVQVKLGQSLSEGAAGSIYYSVPAVVESTSNAGKTQVFTGCYTLRLVQPAAQITPAFEPMGIVKGVLKKSSSPFDNASCSCLGTP